MATVDVPFLNRLFSPLGLLKHTIEEYEEARDEAWIDVDEARTNTRALVSLLELEVLVLFDDEDEEMTDLLTDLREHIAIVVSDLEQIDNTTGDADARWADVTMRANRVEGP